MFFHIRSLLFVQRDHIKKPYKFCILGHLHFFIQEENSIWEDSEVSHIRSLLIHPRRDRMGRLTIIFHIRTVFYSSKENACEKAHKFGILEQPQGSLFSSGERAYKKLYKFFILARSFIHP